MKSWAILREIFKRNMEYQTLKLKNID
jgi:hypothetical protein